MFWQKKVSGITVFKDHAAGNASKLGVVCGFAIYHPAKDPPNINALDQLNSRTMSKLDSFIRRMQAQRACIEMACGLIADLPGVVFELGLGVGRTYSHLSEHLPGREIYVFDRQVLPHVVCVPPDNMLVLGELADTLPRSVEQHHSGVALVHTDIGTADLAYGVKTASFICKHLSGALAPGGIVLSDQELHLPRAEPLTLPDGVAPGRYFMYRASTV